VLQHFTVTFSAIFLAELPDKTMIATLLLSTHFHRRLPVWCGVTLGYAVHVLLAVIFGTALSQLPTTPIHILVGLLFLTGGIMTWRAGSSADHDETAKWSASMSNARVVWTAASVILVAEFGDLTQLATAGFAARFDDPIAVGIGSIAALSSVSGLAVLAGGWLQKKVPLQKIQRAAAVLFASIGIVTLVCAVV
jgi:putative Ca2+/H+ antiporter (TMEM165/GDT1 family)